MIIYMFVHTGEEDQGAENLPRLGRMINSGHSKDEYHIVRLAGNLHIMCKGIGHVLLDQVADDMANTFVPLAIGVKPISLVHLHVHSKLAGQKSTIYEVNYINT